MSKKISIAALSVLALCPVAMGVASVASPDLGGVTMGDTVIRLEARMGARDAIQAKATYQERIVRTGASVKRFSLELEDGAPNTTYDVAHNGVVFGTVTTDAFGFGDFNRREIGDDNGDIGPVPTMAAGDTIEVVGVLSGALRAR